MTIARRAAGVAAMLLFPRFAAACPMCAGQQPGGVARIIALGAMMLLPFSIAFILFKVLGRSVATPEQDAARGLAKAPNPPVGGAHELRP